MENLIDLAIVVFAFTAAWILRRLTRDDDTEQWQQTTKDAATAEDPAETQRHHEIAELEAWLHARPLHRRNTIPHQTRRTEEDQ